MSYSVPTHVYLVTHEGHGAGKVGIADGNADRIAEHEGNAWKFYRAVLLADREQAKMVERIVKNQATKKGVMPFLQPDQVPQGGYSETFDLSRLPVAQAWEMVTEAVGLLPEPDRMGEINVTVQQGRTDARPTDPYEVEWRRCTLCGARTEVLVVDIVWGEPLCGIEDCPGGISLDENPDTTPWQVYVSRCESPDGTLELALGIAPDKSRAWRSRLGGNWVHLGGSRIVGGVPARTVAGSALMRLALRGIDPVFHALWDREGARFGKSELTAMELLLMVETEALLLQQAYEALRQRRAGGEPVSAE